MSAPHVLAPRLAVASDNTTDVNVLLAAKASSSSHGAKITNVTIAFDAGAVTKSAVLPAAISRSVAVAAAAESGMSAEEAQRRKEALSADLKLLQGEFERFQQQQPAPTDTESVDRAAKVEFFLGYTARILREVEVASPAQLKELEVQVKATLLPLKGKVVAQLAASTSAAAPASTEAGAAATTTCMSSCTSAASLASAATGVAAGDLMPKTAPAADAAAEGPLVAGTVRRDDSSFGTTSSEGSSGEEEEDAEAGAGAPLDELDMECFSLIMDEEAGAGAGAVGKKRALEETVAAVVVKAEPPSGGEPEAQAKRQRSMTFDGKQSREVEYQCSSCSESYVMATANNPWWALEQQACPKCNKLQIPRVDITLPANTMDYHPALLAEEGDDDDDDEAGALGGCGAGAFADDFSRVGSVDGEEEAGLGLGTAEEGEEEGATLSPQQAAQLLVLLSHSRTCPGEHKSEAQAALCRTVKFLMLHVRDCDGKTLDGEPCAFSWCRPCKVLLGHLVRCYDGDKCAICNPAASELPKPLADLQQQEQLAGTGCCGGHAHAHVEHAMHVTRVLSVSSTDTTESAATTAPCTPSGSACGSLEDLPTMVMASAFGDEQQQQQAVVGVAC